MVNFQICMQKTFETFNYHAMRLCVTFLQTELRNVEFRHTLTDHTSYLRSHFWQRMGKMVQKWSIFNSVCKRLMRHSITMQWCHVYFFCKQIWEMLNLDTPQLTTHPICVHISDNASGRWFQNCQFSILFAKDLWDIQLPCNEALCNFLTNRIEKCWIRTHLNWRLILSADTSGRWF